MRLWLGAVLVGGLLLGLGSPARALVVDSFSTGSFNLMDTGAGTTATQPCGSFCLGGSREVFLRGAGLAVPATAQLGLGEAQSVLPLGGALSFTYQPALPVDLTVGGTATVIQVSFTAFEPGAQVSLTLEDDTGASQTAGLNPSFPTPPTPAAPGIVAFSFGSFSAVDPGAVVSLQALVFQNGAPSGGDYHITLIEAPVPALSTGPTPLVLTGSTVASGPPFPSAAIPIGVFVPPGPITPIMDIEFSIMNVANSFGPIGASAVGSATPDDNRVLFLQTLVPSTTTATIQYSFDYMAVGGATPDDNVPVLDWTPGNTWFEVSVVVADGDPDRPIVTGFIYHDQEGVDDVIANVSTFQGSTGITVEFSSCGADNICGLNMAMRGELTSTTLVPVFAPHDLAPLLLAVFVMAGAWVLVTRVRRRGAERL